MASGVTRSSGRPADGQWKQACNVILKKLYGMKKETPTIGVIDAIRIVEGVKEMGAKRTPWRLRGVR